jgi:hypothetical protein
VQKAGGHKHRSTPITSAGVSSEASPNSNRPPPPLQLTPTPPSRSHFRAVPLLLKALKLLRHLRSLNVEVFRTHSFSFMCDDAELAMIGSIKFTIPPFAFPHQSFRSIHVGPDTLYEVSALVHPPTQRVSLTSTIKLTTAEPSGIGKRSTQQRATQRRRGVMPPPTAPPSPTPS